MLYGVSTFVFGCSAVVRSPNTATKFKVWTRMPSRPASTSCTMEHPNDHENQTFSLPDGRTLGYAEYGLSNGFPVFAFHGFPSCRLELFPIHKTARRLKLRIIALDRPGFGLSTFQPDRQIIDWPADVLSFAKATQIDQFSVMGLSGGGPYALACAHKLPKGMLQSVGIFAGGPPWEAGRQHMPWFAKLTAWLSNYLPGAFTLLCNGVIGSLRWLLSTGTGTRQLDKILVQSRNKEFTPEEKEMQDENATTEERRERLLNMAFGGFAQGSRAMVQEARLLSAQSWGFKLEDVDYDPVRIWHGSKDMNSPIEMIRYMAKRLPHGILIELDDTHFTMARHVVTALSELVPEEVAQEYSKQV
jgi:pimeloyl-ACP methyl ester carboxylesterase